PSRASPARSIPTRWSTFAATWVPRRASSSTSCRASPCTWTPRTCSRWTRSRSSRPCAKRRTSCATRSSETRGRPQRRANSVHCRHCCPESVMRAELTQGLIDFLKASPTPFHATATLAQRLDAAGYQALDERQPWQCQPGGRYYVTRNDSSIVAFKLGRRGPLEAGLRLVGAHTDSPCLRVKPQPELQRHGFLQLGVEVYGGALLAPWFDRDLSIAGRVTFRLDGRVESRLIDFREPIAVIPNLAIHLNREANQGWAINAQTELPPILAQIAGIEPYDFRALLAEQLSREHDLTADIILDFELSLYDTQPAAVVGLHGDFIAGARLDNLLSCYAGLQALLAADDEQHCVLVCTDHEEVGSTSCCGADGPFLEQVLQRAFGGGEELVRVIQKSLLISA